MSFLSFISDGFEITKQVTSYMYHK